MSRCQEISDATSFDAGSRFETVQEVRSYFTVENMSAMFGADAAEQYPLYADQDELTSMANDVIANKWHCDF